MKRLVLAFTVVVSAFGLCFAKEAEISGGLILLEPPTGRAASLGGAFSAVANDIGAFSYNPASLSSLRKGEASFLFHRRFEDQTYGQFSVGTPLSKGGWGLSAGVYDGGTIDLFDGVNRRTVSAQRDQMVSFGFALPIMGAAVGITGKYLSSELGETARATAMAGDLGLQLPFNDSLRFGAAVQNIGTRLKYVEAGDPLPQIARAGVTWMIPTGSLTTSLSGEAPYYLNEEDWAGSLGFESVYGLLAVRGSYTRSAGTDQFAVGMGFLLGFSNIDYAFVGFGAEQAGQHRMSLSVPFGIAKVKP